MSAQSNRSKRKKKTKGKKRPDSKSSSRSRQSKGSFQSAKKKKKRASSRQSSRAGSRQGSRQSQRSKTLLGSDLNAVITEKEIEELNRKAAERDETDRKPNTGMRLKEKKHSFAPQITISEVERDVREVLRVRDKNRSSTLHK